MKYNDIKMDGGSEVHKINCDVRIISSYLMF